MAFCTQCGAPLPENGKFCSNCGASVEAETHAEGSVAAKANDDLTPVAPPVLDLHPNMDECMGKKPEKKNSTRAAGTWFSIASLVLAVISLLVFSPVIAMLSAAAAIVAGVFAFIKKGRLKALVIIAFLMAAFAVVDSVWYIATGEIMLEPSGTEVAYGQTQRTTGSGKTNAKAKSVDPDLAAFLDSYESCIDEYVAFMKKYMSDPSNVVSMLGDYLDMTEKLADFSEQADRYDADKMSAADAKYYLEVMTRCEMKLLDVIG